MKLLESSVDCTYGDCNITEQVWALDIYIRMVQECVGLPNKLPSRKLKVENFNDLTQIRSDEHSNAIFAPSSGNIPHSSREDASGVETYPRWALHVLRIPICGRHPIAIATATFIDTKWLIEHVAVSGDWLIQRALSLVHLSFMHTNTSHPDRNTLVE